MRLHSTVLVTKQLNRLQRFYTETLGFQVAEDFGACVVLNCGLSLWQPPDAHPVRALSPKPGAEQSEGHPFELCFEADTVAEFEAIAELLMSSELPLLHPIREEPWGQRTLRLRDPDGNLVEWGESIPCFVRRLHATTGSAPSVAAITGVALDRILEILGL